MTVTVISNTADTPEIRFETGDSWHIDPEQHLHVRDADKKHIAVFAHGTWAYATTATADDGDAE